MITNRIMYHTHLIIASQMQSGCGMSYCPVILNAKLEYAFLQSSKDFIK
nr:hypothetical protein [Mucilaginibacter sp. SP1R1]